MTTLAERIAAALSDETTSPNLAELINEVEAAAASADEKIAEARARALDPTVIDADARTALADAEFNRDRMQAALPQLHTRHQHAVARERAAAWDGEYTEVVTRYNALADEWREAYPPILDKLVDLCARAKALTLEIGRINRTSPPGERRRMPEMWTGGQLRLPHLFDDGEHVAWPPPVMSLVQQMARAAMAFPHMFNPPPLTGPPEWIAARNEQRQSDGERVVAYYRDRDRERQERELKEGREALAREVTERNRRAGWG
jgi:hypothetical protein